jgi:hypothetical protein
MGDFSTEPITAFRITGTGVGFIDANYDSYRLRNPRATSYSGLDGGQGSGHFDEHARQTGQRDLNASRFCFALP